MNTFAEFQGYGAQRVGIFIDTFNLFHATKERFNAKIDYTKLFPVLAADRNVIIAKAYILAKDESAKKFECALRMAGFDTAIKDMVFKEYDSHSRNVINWNIGISLDMLSWASKLDTIVLASGGDVFSEVIERIKGKGSIRIEVACFERCTSQRLRSLADSFVEIGPEKDEGNTIPEWLIPIQERKSVEAVV